MYCWCFFVVCVFDVLLFNYLVCVAVLLALQVIAIVIDKRNGIDISIVGINGN